MSSGDPNNDSCWPPKQRRTFFLTEERNPRLATYLLGCLLANILTVGINVYIFDWPITATLVIATTVSAAFGIFMIETLVEGCVTTLIVAVLISVHVGMSPEYGLFTQLWTSLFMGKCVGAFFVGVVRP